ncbi:hypothetical protein BU25DRAFT_305061, partial [Macroventuria anomochaeta]
MTRYEWIGELKLVQDAVIEENVWQFTVKVPHHNHDCAMEAVALFQHRQRDAATLVRIQQQWKLRQSSTNILASLLGDNISIRQQDILNEIARLWREELQGMTPIEALLCMLDEY